MGGIVSLLGRPTREAGDDVGTGSHARNPVLRQRLLDADIARTNDAISQQLERYKSADVMPGSPTAAGIRKELVALVLNSVDQAAARARLMGEFLNDTRDNALYM
jgi:hypothetical protein